MNLELLNRTLQATIDHPELWDQSDWMTNTSSGTAYCFMGWAVHLSFPRKSYIPLVARKALRMEESIASRMSFSGNTLEDLRAMVAYLNKHPHATGGEFCRRFPIIEKE